MGTLPPDGPHTPTDPRDEPYLARLRDADPARGVNPDVDALRAAVAARAAQPVADQLAARRARKVWLPVAAAAAGALVLGGGGGYAIGAQGLGGADAASSMALETAAAEGGIGEAAGAEGGGAPAIDPVAPGVPGPMRPGAGVATESDAAGDSKFGWGGYGRTVFTSSGLSTQGGEAHMWALDAQAVTSKDGMRALADALGLEGPVKELEDGSLVVGSQDGTGPSLWLYPSGTADVGYYNPGADTWRCMELEQSKADAAASSEGDGEGVSGGAAEPLPMPPDQECAEQEFGPAPSTADAEAQLVELLAAVGIEAGDVELESDDSSEGWTSVTAWRLVDGQRSGLAWSGSWTGAGLQSVYGSFAPIVDLGSYAVISPDAAVDRLTDPRFGAGGPVAYAEDAVREDAAADDVVSSSEAPDEAPAWTVPDTPAPGSPLSWPVQTVTIVSAELALSTYYQPDGASVLAPTYQLTGSDGSVWSVIALADSALDF